METIKHRTQISLDDWQYQMLLEESRKTKKSLSGIIRDLVSEHFSRTTRVSQGKKNPILDIIGIGEGDGSSVARDHDKYLYGTKQ